MSTVAGAVCRLWWRRFLVLLAIIAVIAVIAVLTSPQFGAFKVALTPPRLPDPIAVNEQVWRGDQSWSDGRPINSISRAQGTHTLPIPLSWFLALEEPLNSPLAIPFGKRGRFADNRYLLRFGFIGARADDLNPNTVCRSDSRRRRIRPSREYRKRKQLSV